MIAYLKGRLAEVWDNSCLVVTSGGVGYEVALPTHTLASLPAQGEEIAVYTSLAVREDALELYGFASFEERQTFEILVSISRVGARTALAILSVFRPDDLRRIIQEEDVQALARVSGIGKKTSQYIFLELKYKLGADAQQATVSAVVAGTGSVLRDVLGGLNNLGYADEECLPVVKKILQAEPDIDVSSALRLALKSLARG